ncbi:hypothetical protein [Thiomicrospira microaerophila]|uniref:hypothetical protein n=1 Tax=Thiomicrospira microaerophila TaxID=406020 RepID=UPI0005C8E92E|nr:hypothetical protein [Thiomicrospira microaerophila]
MQKQSSKKHNSSIQKQRGSILLILVLMLTLASATFLYNITGKTVQQMKTSNTLQQRDQLNEIKQRLILFASEYNQDLFCQDDRQGYLPVALDSAMFGFNDLLNLDNVELEFEHPYADEVAVICYDSFYARNVCDAPSNPKIASLTYKQNNAIKTVISRSELNCPPTI